MIRMQIDDDGRVTIDCGSHSAQGVARGLGLGMRAMAATQMRLAALHGKEGPALMRAHFEACNDTRADALLQWEQLPDVPPTDPPVVLTGAGDVAPAQVGSVLTMAVVALSLIALISVVVGSFMRGA